MKSNLRRHHIYEHTTLFPKRVCVVGTSCGLYVLLRTDKAVIGSHNEFSSLSFISSKIPFFPFVLPIFSSASKSIISTSEISSFFSSFSASLIMKEFFILFLCLTVIGTSYGIERFFTVLASFSSIFLSIFSLIFSRQISLAISSPFESFEQGSDSATSIPLCTVFPSINIEFSVLALISLFSLFSMATFSLRKRK